MEICSRETRDRCKKCNFTLYIQGKSERQEHKLQLISAKDRSNQHCRSTIKRQPMAKNARALNQVGRRGDGAKSGSNAVEKAPIATIKSNDVVSAAKLLLLFHFSSYFAEFLCQHRHTAPIGKRIMQFPLAH